MKLIDKDSVVAELERRRDAALMRQQNLEAIGQETVLNEMVAFNLTKIISFLDTLEVKDPYEQCVQYASIKGAIKALAETYSFNIESKLFQQLTKEQQKLWRKEIEEACVNAGNAGYLLAKDKRYKENLEVKDVNLEKEISNYLKSHHLNIKDGGRIVFENGDSPNFLGDIRDIAKHFFELGLKAQKGE